MPGRARVLNIVNPLAIKALYWGSLAALSLGAVWAIHDHVWDQGYDAGRDELQAEIDRDAAKAAADARKTDQDQRDAQQDIGEQYEQDKANAQATEDAVVSDLRSDNLRLRRLWQGCESATARVPATAGAEPQLDDEAELRRKAAGAVVRVGADADAQVIALQAALRVCTGGKQ